jgi:glutathione S-transferase
MESISSRAEAITMEIYVDPITPTSRAVLAFCKASSVEPTIHRVSLMKGEHRQPTFLALNPSGMLPVLVDGDFVLTESTVILSYLAKKTGSRLYPQDLRESAKVDEVMAWLGTNFVKDFAYQLVYPQILPQHRRPTEEANRVTIEWGREQSKRWLAVLDRHLLGPERSHLACRRRTVADYQAAAILSLGELVGCAFADYPNVRRFYQDVTTEPDFAAVNADFLAFAASVRTKGPFVTL